MRLETGRPRKEKTSLSNEGEITASVDCCRAVAPLRGPRLPARLRGRIKFILQMSSELM